MGAKRFIPLLLLPLTLTSCGRNSLSLAEAKKIVENYSTETVYPYYKVFGTLDFHGEIIKVDGVTFDRTPAQDKFVPYARYNEGFYNEIADKKLSDFDILIYSLASRSYWLRAPLRINSENFFAYAKDKQTQEYTTNENTSCAHYILEHLVTSYIGQAAAANPSSMHMYIEKLSDGGIAFGGDKVHTMLSIDNYPYYPDYENIPELGEWDETNPLPCFGLNRVNAKVNIRFVYNKDGWLVKESMSTVGYNPKVASTTQVSLEAMYVYDFGPEPNP